MDKNGPTMPGMESPCWVFKGCRDSSGYGTISTGGHRGRMVRVHRLAWEMVNGPIPAGLSVCHRCDNPACCRAEPGPGSHLFLGTHSENMKDAVKKGRLHQIAALPHNRGEQNGRAKLTRAAVAAIRTRFARETAKALAAEYQVSPYTVYAVVQGRIWRDAA